MKLYSNAAYSKFFVAGAAVLSLAACESSGGYRVSSVGSVPADTGTSSADNGTSGSGSTASGGSGTGSGSGSGGGSGGSASGSGTGGGSAQAGLGGNLLVTAGNAVIGTASRQDALLTNADAKLLTPVRGTVTRVLAQTGQTLVDIGNGRSLILNGTGGRLGDALTIDLAANKVIGARSGSPLLGASVLSPTVATGRLAAVNVGNSGPLVTVGGGTAGGTGVVSNVGATVNGALGGATGGTGLVSNVGATVNGALGATAGVGGTQANGALGLNGVLGGAPKK